MKWRKFTIETTTQAVDYISAMLSERGVESLEIEDSVPLRESESREMFVDLPLELPPDDGRARVSFYLSSDSQTREAVFPCGDAPRRSEEPELSEESLLASVREGLEEVQRCCDAGSCTITVSETEDQDWMNSWKEYFHPFLVGDLLIKPAWEETPPEYADRLCLTLEPGAAFGTGTHETTQLCIRQLEKRVQPGMEVLDVGCGSGILALTALTLGADRAVGTDLDPCAITSSRENAALNGFSSDRFAVILGNLLDDSAVRAEVGEKRYDLAVANILAPVIVELIGVLPRILKPGGILITSGILDEKEEDVLQAFGESPEWEVLEVTRQNEWVSVTARRREEKILGQGTR